jgi:hypothetical protein
MNTSIINIITSYYIPKDLKRDEELFETLKKNIESPFTNKIHLFVDDENAMKRLNDNFPNLINNKIIIIKVGHQPLYGDLFKYAIENLPNTICMVTNSDIYIQNCNDIRILNMIQKTKTCFSLSRHESDWTRPQVDNYYGSHDSFLFNPSNIDIDIIKDLNFYQNVLGSEGRVIGELTKKGFKVLNPCLQIIIVHNHSSNYREYNSEWIGIHKCGDDIDFVNKSSYCPPIIINTNYNYQ